MVIKLKNILKLNIFAVIILYLLMYIFPLGLYDAREYDETQDRNPDFYFYRLFIMAMVGIGCSLCLVLIYVHRVAKIKACFLTTIILGIIQTIVICRGKSINYEIYERVNNYGEKIPIFMLGAGNVLYLMIGLANIATIIFSVIGIVVYLREKKNSKFYEDTAQRLQRFASDVEYYRDRASVVNGLICAGIVAMLFFSACVSLEIYGIISLVFGILIPFILYQCFFCVSWINQGKWLGLIVTYIALIYFVYNSIFYILKDCVGDGLSQIGFKEEYAFTAIAVFLIIVSLLISVFGVIDIIRIRKNK